MAALDFPASPTTGQQYVAPNAVTYQWDGVAWIAVGGAGGGWAWMGATPPPSPMVGQEWWRSDPDQTLYVYYDDGNSKQWVNAVPSTFFGAAASGDLQGTYPGPTVKAAAITAAKLAADAKSINAKVTRAANQSIPASTQTLLTWDTVTQDSGPFWAAGAPTRLTVPTAGMYFFGVSADFNTGATAGRLLLELLVNGAGSGSRSELIRYASDFACGNVTCAMRLNAADYVTANVYSTYAITSDSPNTFWIVRVP